MQWHKTFNYEWLTGSIRKDLTPTGRGVWADVLATAGLSRRPGYLERGNGVPWTIEDLAAFWCTPLDDVRIAFNACLKEGRLKIVDENTYFVANYDKYQKINGDKNKKSKENVSMDTEHKEMQGKVMAYKLAKKYPEDANKGIKSFNFEKSINN